MKKLLLTLTMIMSVMALSAQSFTVYDSDGQVVESGSTFYVVGDGADTYGEREIEFDITINEDVSLIGEKVEVQNVSGTNNYFCCFGQCLLSTTFVTNPRDLVAGTSSTFSMHYMYENDIFDVAGLEQVMKYYIYTRENPEDKFIFNVIFKYSLDGVDDINAVESFSNAYPVPASDVVNFDYSFNAGVNSATVAVYNMMGQEVLRSDISGMTGKLSLNVSDLTDGVYFYSLVVNGKTEKSSKLVVRH